MNHTSKKGFTLIELLVVIAIIGLLSSIVFSSLTGARAKGRLAAAQAGMRNIVTAAILCVDGNSTVKLITTGAGTLDAQGDGTADVCTATGVTTTKYGALPTGWVYCNDQGGTQGVGNCGNDLSVPSPISLRAEGDATNITCTESGCVTNTTDVD
ncbi:MAG: type II secretion system protein [bacterium]|nr:type II secretion system protein [bacterium]